MNNKQTILIISILVIFSLQLAVVHADYPGDDEGADDYTNPVITYPLSNDVLIIPPELGVDNKYLKECKPCENQPKPTNHGIGVYWPVYPYNRPFFDNSADEFWADRNGEKGIRWHAANDYVAPPGTSVRAVTDGFVLDVWDYYRKSGGGYLQAVSIYNKALDVTFVYGEIVAPQSLIGKNVNAGQKLGTIELNSNPKPSSMLHFMVFKGKYTGRNTGWYKGRPNPGVYDPTDFMKLLYTKYRTGCKGEIKVTPKEFMTIKTPSGNPRR